MARKLKSFRKYIRKIKNPKPRSFSSMLSGCKHPRTASFAVNRADRHRNEPKKDEAATLYDIDQFLLENFRSLYLDNGDESENYQQQQQEKKALGISDEKKKVDFPSQIFESRRFFVAIGPSSSLMEEARLSLTKCPEEGDKISTIGDKEEDGTFGDKANEDSISDGSSEVDCNEDSFSDESSEVDYTVDDYTTVKTYSWDPYRDFKNSMEEMIEAKLEQDGKIDWNFMEELLVCYLDLNEKGSLKFIISAFVDLVASFGGKLGGLKPELGTGKDQ